MIVHHLKYMKPACGIQEVSKEDRMYFTPDTLVNAKKKDLHHADSVSKIINSFLVLFQ
ncbi:hypothetical protein [Nitrosopumilus sp.]|uniref:hypothetical protein n=1 Tax=Nitrosopumilus sp. TaxID=2024843 RepID=UPI003B58F0BE